MTRNKCHGGFPIHHFVHYYMHNLKTKGHIRMFYLLNDCSTTGDIYSFGQNCMQHAIGELWIQTHIATTFRYDTLCVHVLYTSICNSKTAGRMWKFYISNDCFTIGDAYFLCQCWMRDQNGELHVRLQTCITVSFQYATCMYQEVTVHVHVVTS